MFKWIPIGDQKKVLLESPKMVHDDILVAKLRPGQEIEARWAFLKFADSEFRSLAGETKQRTTIFIGATV